MLKKLETATAAKTKNYGRSHTAENCASKTPFVPNAQAKPFVPSNQNVDRQGFFTNVQQSSRPNVPQPNTHQNSAVQPIDTASAPVCYYHQTSGDKAHTCRDPLAVFFKVCQSKVATLASDEITETRLDAAEITLPTLSPSKLLYVADKRNKCKYLVDTGSQRFT